MNGFLPEQIAYMKNLGLSMDFDNLSSEDWILIEDTVGDRLMYAGLNDDYSLNAEGIICKIILNMLS